MRASLTTGEGTVLKVPWLPHPLQRAVTLCRPQSPQNPAQGWPSRRGFRETCLWGLAPQLSQWRVLWSTCGSAWSAPGSVSPTPGQTSLRIQGPEGGKVSMWLCPTPRSPWRWDSLNFSPLSTDIRRKEPQRCLPGEGGHREGGP